MPDTNEPEGPDKRRYPRVHVPDGVHIACEGVDAKFRGVVRVVSQGGVFIQTPRTLPQGSRLRIRIRFDGEVLEADCVVRDLEEQGMGVEFFSLTNEQQESLARLTLKVSS